MNRIFKYISAICLCIIAGSASVFGQSQLQTIKHYIQSIENSTILQHATLSVTIYNITTQTYELQHHSQKSLIPASVLKLLTTGIALDELGKDFRFSTRIYADTLGILDNVSHLPSLYIEGSGDPLLGSYRYSDTKPEVLFKQWSYAISTKTNTSIQGKIYYNSSIFDAIPVADSWQWADIGNYFGTGALGLNFHENMFFLTITPHPNNNNRPHFQKLTPAYPLLRFRNLATFSQGKDVLLRDIGFFGDPHQYERTIYGAISPTQSSKTIRGATPQADKMLCLLFADHLRQQHLLHSTKDSNLCEPLKISSAQKQKLSLLHTTYSHPLKDIIRHTNFTSNNLYAESLLKYLGYRHSGTIGTHHSGRLFIESWLQKHGINTSGLRMADGCGLSRNNLITGNLLCDFLNLMYRNSSCTDFLHSLPVAGVSGTMKNHLKNTPAENNMKVKSGSMEGVISYAGYVQGKDKQMRCFAVMLNNHTEDYITIRPELLQLLNLISTLP